MLRQPPAQRTSPPAREPARDSYGSFVAHLGPEPLACGLAASWRAVVAGTDAREIAGHAVTDGVGAATDRAVTSRADTVFRDGIVSYHCSPHGPHGSGVCSTGAILAKSRPLSRASVILAFSASTIILLEVQTKYE